MTFRMDTSGQQETTERVPKLLRLADVVSLTGLSRSAIYDGMDADMFPRSYRLTARAAAWKPCELNAWADALAPSGQNVV